MGKAIFVGLAAALALSSGPLIHRAFAASVATGTITVELSLRASPGLPDGSSLSVQIGFYVPGQDTINGILVTPPEISVAGRKAVLTVKIPYKLLVSSRSDPLMVHASVFRNFGNEGVTESSDFSSQIAIPADGTDTVVPFAGSI